jgi:hypothetical protein
MHSATASAAAKGPPRVGRKVVQVYATLTVAFISGCTRHRTV